MFYICLGVFILLLLHVGREVCMETHLHIAELRLRSSAWVKLENIEVREDSLALSFQNKTAKEIKLRWSESILAKGGALPGREEDAVFSLAPYERRELPLLHSKAQLQENGKGIKALDYPLEVLLCWEEGRERDYLYLELHAERKRNFRMPLAEALTTARIDS